MKKLGEQLKGAGGFPLVVFTDYNEVPCCLAASTLALNAVPGSSAIWLGTKGHYMHLPRGQVESLILHLQTWLESRQFDLSLRWQMRLNGTAVETPETDAATFRYTSGHGECSDAVPVETAKRLEAERNEALAELKRLRSADTKDAT